MIHYILVENEYDALNWCKANGYTYLGTYYKKGQYVLEYDDGLAMPMSNEEMDYYVNIAEQMEQEAEFERKKKEESKKDWVIASVDDYYGPYNRLYKGVGNSNYTYNIGEAKRYTKAEAQRIAGIMTSKSRTGRTWFGMSIKSC